MESFLTKQAILAADDLETEVVPVPEWGGSVLVRTLTGTQVDAYQEALMVGHGTDRHANLANARIKLIVRSVVTSDGDLMFAEHDVAALGKKSTAALQRVFDVATRLSRLSKEDLDELTENFGDGQSDDSTSA